MTKYTVASQRRNATQLRQTHVIWRGIGCLLILLVPLISYTAAVLTVQTAVSDNWPMPYQLMGRPVMPTLAWSVRSLAPAWAFIEAQNNLYAILATTLMYIIIASAIISLSYAIVYRFVGPQRYGPLDAPPPIIKTKPYKR